MNTSPKSPIVEKKQIILIGASVGRYWKIENLPERISCQRYKFSYIHGGSSFDKSEKIREVLARTEDKPDVVFLKECAAYFPGDLEDYKKKMIEWITDIFKSDIIPIPTTVVPVTRLHSIKKFVIDILKRRNPFNFGNPFLNKRNKAILEYNDWIRSYCKKNQITILDLEAALRYSEKNRYLREDLAKIDGLHLNKKAYDILDKILIPTLNTVNWQVKK